MAIGHLVLKNKWKTTKYRAKCHSLGVSSEANTMSASLYVDTCMKYHYPYLHKWKEITSNAGYWLG